MKPAQYSTTAHSWTVVDRAALEANIKYLADIARGNKKDFMLMVKADGYGHGLIESARIGQRLRSRFLGVSHFEEARQLRKHGITSPLLLFTEPPAAAVDALRDCNVTPVIGTMDFLRLFLQEHQGGMLAFHLKINTGLNRYGFNESDITEVISTLKKASATPQGLLTHYSSVTSDLNRTKQEYKKFQMITRRFREVGFEPQFLHASNSGGTVWVEEPETNMVRLGLAAYGLQPSNSKILPLVPALSWYARLTSMSCIKKGALVGYGGKWIAKRDSAIGVVSVGYSDGLRRSPSHQDYVLGGGRRLAIIGDVMMNHTIIDLTDAQDTVSIGDEIAIIGKQGSDVIAVEDVAVQLETINEEVITAISSSIPRIYIH